MNLDEPLRKTFGKKQAARKSARLFWTFFALVLMASPPVCAQSAAETIGSAAIPAISTTAAPRAAPKFTDPSIGFEIEYKVEDAKTCVVWPQEIQDAACEGIDLQKATAFFAKQNSAVLSSAFLRYEDGIAVVAVMHVPGLDNLISKKRIENFMTGILQGLQAKTPGKVTMSGSTPGSRYDEIKINDIDALRFEMQSDVPRGTAAYAEARTVGYMLLGKPGPVVIKAMTDPEHIEQTRKALASIVNTTRLPKATYQEVHEKVDKTSPAPEWQQGRRIGIFISIVFVSGMLASVLLHALRKRK